MLIMNLNPIFKLRGIEKPFTYLVQNGFSRHAANILINAKNRVYRLDHVEKLCELLICEPNDLLAWIPNNKEEYPTNYPLSKLKHHDTGNIKEVLSKTPLSELKMITENIINAKSE